VILGAIYSAGIVRLYNGHFTGPVIADRAVLAYYNLNFLDDEFAGYYVWPTGGFGDYEDYDWPKQIAQWEPID